MLSLKQFYERVIILVKMAACFWYEVYSIKYLLRCTFYSKVNQAASFSELVDTRADHSST